VSLFAGQPVREAIEQGRADFVPVFLSDIPTLFATGAIRLDVALLQLSPPDRHGYCTLGTSVDAALAAAQHATHIVAEINERMPRTHGNLSIAHPDFRGELDQAFAHTRHFTLGRG
jgi:acyl-CoA hydrolase